MKTARLRDLAQAVGVSLDIEDAAGGDIMAAALSHLVGSTRPEFLFPATIANNRYHESLCPDAPRRMAGAGDNDR
ncbi:MAG: hypothetical protein V3U26_04415 [Dehalococcoidia bacterium]